MKQIIWNSIWFICIIAVACGGISLATDVTTGLICFSLALLAYLVYHIYWLNQLHQWLSKPVLNQIPSGIGHWSHIFSLLYHEHRKNSRSQSQLSNALERFTFAAGVLPDAVVVLNVQNEIEWFNASAIEQLNLKKNNDEGSPINYLIRQKEFTDYINANDFSESLKLTSWLNPDITFELLLIPFGAQQKMLLFRDISSFVKTETMRKDFIANISHELRTPLTVIGGFLETITDMPGEVSDTVKPYFSMMQEQTSRMRNIIEDLLALSKIENSTDALEETILNMNNLIEVVHHDAKGLSQGKHTLQISVDERLNLIGAQSELISAFSNLVSNAIRYTPEGGTIHIQWSLIEGKPTFTVSDTGLGIEQQHIDRLTERFYRVDNGRSRETGGTGLGLSIVKHILNRHKATLDIRSEVGVGSDFSIIFPAASAQQQTPAHAVD